jgi:hypothetical protein
MNQTKRSEFRRVPVRGSHDWTTCSKARLIFFIFPVEITPPYPSPL